jgi:hypothetical protein
MGILHHADRLVDRQSDRASAHPRDLVARRKQQANQSPTLEQIRTLQRIGYHGVVVSRLHADQLVEYLAGRGGAA